VTSPAANSASIVQTSPVSFGKLWFPGSHVLHRAAQASETLSGFEQDLWWRLQPFARGFGIVAGPPGFSSAGE
jgi:hypothetical protein